MSAQTLNTIARSQAKDLGDATAFATPFRRWSYRDVDEASNRVAQGLKSLGIGPGDRVATLTRHVVECLVLTIAATKLQAVCMPVNWRLAPPEIDYILGNGEARFLMADRDFADSLSRIPAATTIKNVLTEDGPPLNGLESFSAWYRNDGLIQLPVRSSGISVGRIPIITMWAPSVLALVSAAFRLARTSISSSSAVRPGNGRGGTLNSML